MAYNAKWGILATGGIAKTFVKDLLKDSKARGAEDVTHTVTAVASSSSKARAEQFITEINIPGNPAAYGSYHELVNDPNVDIIYVATPHSHHYQNARLALEAGKHVLCEKAFTVNAAQAKILVDLARKKNLFLMEAVWTRYFPLSVEVRSLIQKGEIGEVLRVTADNSTGDPDWDPSHRMVNLDLAGGALLDLGIYSLTWVFQTLYHTLPPSQRKAPSSIASTMAKHAVTGADESTTMLITFPTTTPSNLPNRTSHAVAMTSLTVDSNPDKENSARPAIRIQGTKGEIQVDGPAFRPPRYRVIPKKQGDTPVKIREIENPFPANGHGMYWEADEVARCVRDGKLESEGMSWEESIVIMEVMDEVRKQNGLVYPEKIESTEYPIKL
ncbi:putative dimeric dihydrodiol dehydrogenase [Talaromyces proteolyticus]|uniref:D-xylose 1-dehydrogenase (NADP(+), D-xylono-1,5-lactone-forming) n=1 Tax=Talaromyces proteolyticus TaxID=1131652 RepID=A0AAD4L115_9EURO|nr:putative dimeric dihydrodiol dehydrogenase [Talaromyces proteolyticus]KAH8704264.1 putative dimeric dihydrodiol dehydrogenase [Talaromyces proteolyticus]